LDYSQDSGLIKNKNVRNHMSQPVFRIAYFGGSPGLTGITILVIDRLLDGHAALFSGKPRLNHR